MQKKLQRLDEIIRNSYTDGIMKHGNYMEATKMLVDLSNELKLLNLACVIKAEGDSVCVNCIHPDTPTQSECNMCKVFNSHIVK